MKAALIMKPVICIQDNSNLGMSHLVGRIGKADFSTVEKTGNVMFYPDGGHPYRAVLDKTYVKEIEK